MSNFLQTLINFGPSAVAVLVLLAICFGGGLAAILPWLLKNPSSWLFFVIVFLCLVGIGGSGTGAEGSFSKQLIWSALFFYCGVWLIATTPDWAQLLSSIPVGLVLLLMFTATSIFWSPVPLVSLRRYIQLIGVVLLSLFVAQQVVQGRGLLEILFVPFALFLLVGLIQALFLPSTAFDVDGALGAMGTHKNTWGQFSVLCCLFFMVTLAKERRWRWSVLIFLALALTSLFGSKSTTSVLAFGVIGGLVVCWGIVNRMGRVAAAILLLSVTLILVAVHICLVLTGRLPFELIVEGLFGVTGKNTTLTGRTFLWELMYTEIARHPLLGLGYGSFWMGLDGASRAIIGRLDWGPPTQAHNGYIDVINEIGLVGAIILFLALAAHAYGIFRLFRKGEKNVAIFHVSILIGVLIINYAESTLLRTTHLLWVVLCISMVEVKARQLISSALLTKGSLVAPT